jgi:glycosyltransferase involved in cell wall biosynthesis
MAKNNKQNNEPLVSVLIPTYNRRRYLSEAIGSVVNQDYGNLEIFVIRDGGEDVGDIVKAFNDPRIIFINRDENRGIPYTLNQGLVEAGGKYICYLGNDDLYYPHHVNTLVNALENETDCQVAYSDLYRVYCRIKPDGKREILSKVVDISRDFERFVMLYFNHTLHVSMMHRRDLLGKTGFYNESLNVLVDWDLTRRLVFFTDFYHVHEVTGEFYNPVGDSDRVSVKRRKNKQEYLRNAMTVRTTRPAKPWSKIKDLSIIFVADKLDQKLGDTLRLIWGRTFYPYEVYLPLPKSEFGRLQTDMPNIINVDVDSQASQSQRIDAALARCEGEYVAIVPNGFSIEEFWVEDPLYGLINSLAEREGFMLEGATDDCWGVVLKKEDLLQARRSFPNLPIRKSLEAAGIMIRRLRSDEIPFQFDQLLWEARMTGEEAGDWRKAAEIFEYIAENYHNELYIKQMAADAFFRSGRYDRAIEISSQINRQRPTVDSLLIEAKAKREKKDFNEAIKLLERAEGILEGINCYGQNAKQHC